MDVIWGIGPSDLCVGSCFSGLRLGRARARTRAGERAGGRHVGFSLSFALRIIIILPPGRNLPHASARIRRRDALCNSLACQLVMRFYGVIGDTSLCQVHFILDALCVCVYLRSDKEKCTYLFSNLFCQITKLLVTASVLDLWKIRKKYLIDYRRK